MAHGNDMLDNLAADLVPVNLIHQALIQLQHVKFHIGKDIHVAVFGAEIIQGYPVAKLLKFRQGLVDHVPSQFPYALCHLYLQLIGRHIVFFRNGCHAGYNIRIQQGHPGKIK